MIDYEGRKFRLVKNSPAGETGAETIFHYRQTGSVVWATYEGGGVRFGTLIATIESDDSLTMRYQHVNVDGSFRAGECRSVPEVLSDGRLRLHETWRWTSGASGRGESIIEEISS